MWDLIVSVPDHCLSFYFVPCSASWGLNNIFHVFNGLEENIVNKSFKPDKIKT